MENIIPNKKKFQEKTNLGDLLNADAAHRADGKGADQRVGVRAVLDEGVDGHDGKVGLRLGVVHEVQIDELLELEVIRLHAVDDVGEEGADVCLFLLKEGEC
jgi:hypothetical protein